MPPKADALLLVDADALLAAPVAFQRLEAITGRHAEIIQYASLVQ